nr:retrovirus-related Pol polyprotein from transposon TNT 1-94 [Tanacetum cinerariifolium]
GSSQNKIGDKGYWDSGYSRNMTGYISYLSDFEPYDGGYVSFGQGGCKITGKWTIKMGKLEFENVFFMKDLKYNLFSVSQICNNKNSVLFTDSECIVLGRDFKLLDDANILLRTLRQHNMYSTDLNNIIPHRDLTCLVVKASANECMLCHKRLEFRNKELNDFCSKKGIKREFSNAKTPQQNGVAKRRNRLLIEAARTMLADAKLPVTFWAEAVNTACYVQNRVLVNKAHNKSPYELFNGRTPAIGFLKPFGFHVMILNTLDNLGKFEAKGDEGYFLRYSMSSKAFRVFNKRTKRVEENLHIEFLENKAIEKSSCLNWLFDIDSLTKSINYVPLVDVGTNSTNFSGTKVDARQDVKKDVSSLRYIVLPNWVHEERLESPSSQPQDACNTDAPESNILRVTTNSKESSGVEADVSNMETTITASPTPTLRIYRDHPKSQIIGPVDTLIQTRNKSKENKKDKRGIVIKTKARLVAQRHTQEEGIDYDEVFAPVARIEAIRLFLAYASFMGFTVYQMDVKSAFLYGTIDKEVSDKSKEGLGYTVVPPPTAQLYLSPKKDLSWTGLLECADDTVTDYSRPSPTVESSSEEDQNRIPSASENVTSPITPKQFVKFVKASDSQSKSKTDENKTHKKPPVKYAEQYRKPNKKPNIRGNQRN